ncbi:MAG TPA: hypothetical protein VNA24_07420 [Hyalangium sp.]|jgi:hypothetical protein|nr:hypothetical protein [Hyalangium sp.]
MPKPLSVLVTGASDVGSKNEAIRVEWFNTHGYTAGIAWLCRDDPEVGWRTFEEWVRAQDRKKLLA